MPAQPPPAGPGVYFVVTIMILVALLFVGMLLLRLSAYLGAQRQLASEQKQRYGVKRFDALQQPRLAPRPEPLHMSSSPLGYTPDRPVAPLVAQPVQQPRQPIATTNNAINSELHPVAELPDEARDIIRFQARVETVVSLYKSGQVTNLAKAIEATFECSRTSKEESTYQRAKRAIDPLIAKPVAPTPIAGRPTSAVFQSDLEEVV